MSASRITTISGRVIVLRGNDVDTDRIMPARFLKAITFAGLERHLFEDARRAASEAGGRHPFDEPTAASAMLLVAGANFGCGSSREHAPQALYRSGIRAVVAESFADIFFSNAATIGLPCAALSAANAEELRRECEADSSVEVTLSLEDMTLRTPAHRFPVTLPDGLRQSFITGSWDATAALVDSDEDVQRVMNALPYIRGF